MTDYVEFTGRAQDTRASKPQQNRIPRWPLEATRADNALLFAFHGGTRPCLAGSRPKRRPLRPSSPRQIIRLN